MFQCTPKEFHRLNSVIRLNKLWTIFLGSNFVSAEANTQTRKKNIYTIQYLTWFGLFQAYTHLYINQNPLLMTWDTTTLNLTTQKLNALTYNTHNSKALILPIMLSHSRNRYIFNSYTL